MTSKSISILSFFIIPLLFSAENHYGDSGIIASLRPVILRSEFASRSTIRMLQTYSQQIGYTPFGYPDFGDAVISRPLHFWETKLAQTRYYGRYLNKRCGSKKGQNG